MITQSRLTGIVLRFTGRFDLGKFFGNGDLLVFPDLPSLGLRKFPPEYHLLLGYLRLIS